MWFRRKKYVFSYAVHYVLSHYQPNRVRTGDPEEEWEPTPLFRTKDNCARDGDRPFPDGSETEYDDRYSPDGSETEYDDRYSPDGSETKYSDRYSPDGSETKYSDRYSSDDLYSRDSVDLAVRQVRSANTQKPSAVRIVTKMTFVEKMFEHIRAKNLRETDVYKSAGIDRRLFSKISADQAYKPSKDTCFALCFALELSLEEAQDLLERAGYAISHSDVRELLLEYCFVHRICRLREVNEVLYDFHEKPLGRDA